MFNKVIYKGTEILNVSNDTVVAEALHAGYTAHDSNGVPITGVAKTYEEGYAAGQASGGGGGASDPAAEAVMAAMALSTSTILGSWNSSPANGMFTCSGSDTATTIGIILDNIVEIHSSAYCISQLWYLANTPPIILSLPKIPPIAGIGSFVVENTNHKPKVIYVPDESVGAYKAAEYWSEFADFIKPMSELVNGSGDGDNGETEQTLITFTIEELGEFNATEGMTWRTWCKSDYNDTDTMCSTAIIDPEKEIVAFEGNNGMPLYMSGADDVEVHPDDVIVAGATYYR